MVALSTQVLVLAAFPAASFEEEDEAPLLELLEAPPLPLEALPVPVPLALNSNVYRTVKTLGTSEVSVLIMETLSLET